MNEPDDDVRLCIITGVLALLASLAESLDILCEIEKERFEPWRKEHKVRLKTWKLMRHDGVHPADRIFREPRRANQNDPRMPNGDIYAFVFDHQTGTLQTGEKVLSVQDEIDAARTIGHQAVKLAGFDWDNLL